MVTWRPGMVEGAELHHAGRVSIGLPHNYSKKRKNFTSLQHVYPTGDLVPDERHD